VASVSADDVRVWSVSGAEGTVERPKVTITRSKVTAELGKALAELAKRVPMKGVVLQPDHAIALQGIADVIDNLRAARDGTALFPDVVLTM
jgi:hypothetical protein